MVPLRRLTRRRRSRIFRRQRPFVGRASRAKIYNGRAHRIAIGLAVISLIAISPALKHWDLAAAPAWARASLLWSALQLAYAVWLTSVPDWSALWVAMIVFATTATLYGTVGTVALAMPPEFDLPLDLAPVRSTATLWCFTMAAIMIGAAYGCGRVAQRAKRAG